MTRNNMCRRCNGTGRFKSWNGRELGDCFTCKGTGSVDAAYTAKRNPLPSTVDCINIVDCALIIKMWDVWERGGTPTVRLGDYTFKWWTRRITDGHMIRIYISSADGRCGHIAVSQAEGEQGILSPEWGMTSEDTDAIMKVLNQDLEEAMVQYGRLTGNCSCCGLTLTNPDSIERGIGPICASKYGF